jgi:Flp pilus assembly protein TadD
MKSRRRACQEDLGGRSLRVSVPKTGKKLYHGLPTRVSLLVVCAALCVASAGGVESSEPPRAARLEIVYPADGSVFPPDIIAPTFRWEVGDDAAGPWRARLRDHEGRVIASRLTSEPSWRPGATEWEEVKRRSVDRAVVLSVGAESPAGATPSAEITLRTAREPVGDSLFYREVPLPFLDAVRDPARIRWRYGTIDMEEGPPVVLENLPVCGNCHSFADDGSVLGLDVDYGNDKGGYGLLPVAKRMVMSDESIITWSDYRRDDGDITFGLLSRVSPDGRYVISTVKDRSVFVARDDLMISQLFFPIKGILVVFDRDKDEFFALPGADDPRYVQTNPVWSPDGREILFARTDAHQSEELDRKKEALLNFNDVSEFTRDGAPFRYDIYRIPFNDGKGGKATPLEGAADNGMSNYFPKYSPDGKWIVFTKSKDYMLLRLDSELYIVPTAGGEARRLRHNTDRMNSWHSWSSNSRWLVFSSKQNGPYTQLWLTHIDEEGDDTPPVVLERFTAADRAGNIPEFVNLPGDAIVEIREEFLNPYSFLRAGTANQRTGDQEGAERSFRRGLERAPDDPGLRAALGWTLFQTGRPAEAVREYGRALAVSPDDARTHNNLALALLEIGDLTEAGKHFTRSLAIEPRCEIYADFGLLQDLLGREDLARQSYEKGFALDETCPAPRMNLAAMLIEDGKYEEATFHYGKAIEGRPSAEAHSGLGFALNQLGRLDEAAAEHEAAVALDPSLAKVHRNRALTQARLGAYEEAILSYRRAVAIEPRVSTYYSLAGVLRAAGRGDEAEAEYRRGRELSRRQQAPPPPGPTFRREKRNKQGRR